MVKGVVSHDNRIMCQYCYRIIKKKPSQVDTTIKKNSN